jgi:hypothetical protein
MTVFFMKFRDNKIFKKLVGNIPFNQVFRTADTGKMCRQAGVNELVLGGFDNPFTDIP